MGTQSTLDFVFAAPVLKRDDSWSGYHYLVVPPETADAFRAQGVRRVIASLNDVDVRRALQRTRDGEDFLVLGLHILRDIGALPGHPVMVHLTADPEPDRVDMGEEFEAVLEQDEEAAERFYAMTPGRQRSLAYFVTSAKRTETRIKRALELARKLRTNTLYGDRSGD